MGLPPLLVSSGLRASVPPRAGARRKTCASPSARFFIEMYAWIFMRMSGLLLVFLVLGHLFIMLLLDGGVRSSFSAERDWRRVSRIASVDPELARFAADVDWREPRDKASFTVRVLAKAAGCCERLKRST